MSLAPDQEVTLEAVPVFGPDPISTAQADFIAALYQEGLSGRANPASNGYGIDGFGPGATYADLGAQQGFLSVRASGNRGNMVASKTPSLPNTSGQGQSASVQDLLGSSGL